MITSSSGGLLERYSYDPFGRVRAANGADAPATSNTAPWGGRGFTGHETLQAVGGLIHMNGRIFNPYIGRFMTADPQIQAPGMSQSYNRYSYIMNNPLGGTDPSGFGWFSDFFHSVNTFLQNPFKIENAYSVLHNQPGGAHVDRFMMGHEWARVIGHAAANFWAGYACGWGCASSAESFLTGYEVYLSGGSHGDIQRATLISFGTSAASYGVGSYATNPVANTIGHALV